MYIIKYENNGFNKYLCTTWGGDIVWTLTLKRALILPQSACKIMQEEIKKYVNINTIIEKIDIDIFKMDSKFNIENFPNV